MRADGGHHHAWDTGVNHASSSSKGISSATSWSGNDDTWRKRVETNTV